MPTTTPLQLGRGVGKLFLHRPGYFTQFLQSIFGELITLCNTKEQCGLATRLTMQIWIFHAIPSKEKNYNLFCLTG